MDVLFLPTGGRPKFKIEIGYFDTVNEIKAKIQKYQGIPVSDIENLILGDKSLYEFNDLSVFDTDITHRSKVQLVLNKNPKPLPSKTKKTIKFLVRTPVSRLWEEMEFDLEDDTVAKLKEKICESAKIETSRVYVYANGGELEEDEKSLRECKLFDNCRVFISFVKIPHHVNSNVSAGISSSTTMDVSGEKIKVVLVVFGMNEKIVMVVDGRDSVEELRNVLEKIKDRIRLPEGGYFFIHNHKVMEELENFRWHEVADGDTIEVFPGKVTSGKNRPSRK